MRSSALSCCCCCARPDRCWGNAQLLPPGIVRRSASVRRKACLKAAQHAAPAGRFFQALQEVEEGEKQRLGAAAAKQLREQRGPQRAQRPQQQKGPGEEEQGAK